MAYNFKSIESKWQKIWEEKGIYKTDVYSDKVKAYILVEFPYPSGAGLHVGHVKSYTAMDIVARKMRAAGKEVLYPIGWDAFGLPTENYAIKTGIHPSIVTKDNIDTFRRQLKSCGFSFDWDREVDTTDPNFYKWSQWIFLKLYENGLAYKKKMPVNWCPKDKCVLANEEVVDGCCERCGAEATKRDRDQWMLAITKYAERLDCDLDDTDYLPKIKTQQRNWIGMSEGSEIEFRVQIPSPDINTMQGPSPSLPTREGVIPAYYTANIKKYESLKLEADKMRKSQTLAEKAMWDILRENFEGFNFRRQYIVGDFIVDFICLSKGIAIEVDGGVHSSQVDRDKERDNFISDKNIKVIRFTNYQVFNNSEEVIKIIETELRSREVLPCGEDLGGALGFSVFTTRADTIFGCTYCVLAPEHPLVDELINNKIIKNSEEVINYREGAKLKKDFDRSAEGKEKTGVRLDGVVAINPASGEELPLFIADYVLPNYGTGAIMAVPAHDKRDQAFAEKKNLEIRKVIMPRGVDFPIYSKTKELIDEHSKVTEIKNNFIFNVLDGKEMFTADGYLINSAIYNGMGSEEARQKITQAVGGKVVKKSKLRDWVFARQRYWGEPIPIVYDENNVMHAVAESEFPIILPNVTRFEPTDNGESPLALAPEWVYVYGNLDESGHFISCKKIDCAHHQEASLTNKNNIENKSEINEIDIICKKFRRETDTMPQWAGSSWYFMRYIDPHNNTAIGDKSLLAKWLPVDWYNGGMEHTTLHLLYSRFWYKFLYDIGVAPTSEPYYKRTSQGMILGAGGVKMSKSLGNVVNPDSVIEKYGADVLRLYEMFMGPFDQAIAWDDKAIIGAKRFLDRVETLSKYVVERDNDLPIIAHKTIKLVSEGIDNMGFNVAVSALMIYTNTLFDHVQSEIKNKQVPFINKNDYVLLLKLLSPFAPHMTEEIWQVINYDKNIDNFISVHQEPWPAYDEEMMIADEIVYALQINGKLRDTFIVNKDDTEEMVKVKAQATAGYEKYVGSIAIKKVIFIKGKLVNVVV